MAFLTIAGITIEVQTDGASRAEGDVVGERVRAFDGTMRSTVRAEKAEWQFTTGPMTAADVATLRAAIALDTPVTCAGDALPSSTTCQVRVTGEQFLQDASQASDFSLLVDLRLVEV